jgi:glycosyltransferase involved in cell wall biosynthesis
MNNSTEIRSVQVVSSLTKEFQGLSTAVAVWSRSLARLGDEVQLVSTAIPIGSPPANVLPAIHTEVQPSRLSRVWAAHSWHAKKQLLPLILAADVVHVHGLWHHPGYVAAKLAIKHGKPLVISPHGEIMPVAMNIHRFRKAVYMRFLSHKLLSAATGFHAMTPVEEQAVSLNFPGSSTVVIPNGIEPVEPPSSNVSELANSLWPSLTGRTVILFMGRLHHIKGIDILLKALKKAVEKNNNLALLIAGSDFGAEAELRQLSRELNLENHVVWAGHIDGQEMQAALALSDMFVLPSKSDVIGLATLEAMQAGVPVIITEECGGEIVEEKEAGIIVKSNPESMSLAIVKLANDHDLTEKLGANGKRTVELHFDTKASSTKLNSFYRSLIN